VRLDLTVIVGIVIGVLALLLGFLFGGGNLGALLEATSALIVFGGTIGATVVSFSIRDIRRIPQFIRNAFTATNSDYLTLINQLCEAVSYIRHHDRIHLVEHMEEQAGNTPVDPFLLKGFQDVADAVDVEDLRGQLETQMFAEHESDQRGVQVFEVAGGYAPTMGIAGTVMGLIHVLGSLNGGATQLAASIGMAFTATLYGVGSANLFWLPVSANLKAKSKQRFLMRELMVTGLVFMATGTKPDSEKILRTQLVAYLQASTGGGHSSSAESNGTSADLGSA